MLVTDLNPLLSNKQSLILSNADAINGSMYNILFTIPGSRRFFPTYGIGIQTWLGSNFNQIDPVYYSTKIINQISLWEPRAQSVNVTVTFNNVTSVMSVFISYNFIVGNVSVPSSFTVNVPF